MRRSPDRWRLLAALLFSLLLHAALMLPSRIDAPPGPVVGAPATLVMARLQPTTPAGPDLAPATTDRPSASTAPPALAPDTPANDEKIRYYRAAELTAPPRPVDDINLDIPEARLLTTPGILTLTLWIDPRGQVLAFHVEAPDLPAEYATAVAEAFSALRFAPGEMHGRKVSSILTLEITHSGP